MKFGNAEPMRRMFAAITYCGGGIAATGDAFALTALLGHEHVTGTFDLRIYEYTP